MQNATTEDERVTLAGVRFRLGRRHYGKRLSVVLRTSEGKAYRLTPEESSKCDGLTYIHDIVIDGVKYRVYVAPPDSDAAKELQGEPVSIGIGAPVFLRPDEGDGECFAVRRLELFDGKPDPELLEPESDDGLSPRLLAKVSEIAKLRGVSEKAALDKIIVTGIARFFAIEKNKKKPKPKASKHRRITPRRKSK